MDCMRLIFILVFDESLWEGKILLWSGSQPQSFKFYLNNKNQLWFQQEEILTYLF